jgi:hypothetical protein
LLSGDRLGDCGRGREFTVAPEKLVIVGLAVLRTLSSSAMASACPSCQLPDLFRPDASFSSILQQ